MYLVYRYKEFITLDFLLSYRIDTSTITSSGFMVLGNFLTELGDSQLASMDKVCGQMYTKLTINSNVPFCLVLLNYMFQNFCYENMNQIRMLTSLNKWRFCFLFRKR